MNVDSKELTADLKQVARELGFHLCAVAPTVTPTGFSRLLEWLERGYAGEMDYIERRLDAYRDPAAVLAGTRSILMLGFPYRTADPLPAGPLQGRIARYAWGEADYHDLVHPRLKRLQRWLHERVPGCEARGVVDTAPLLEREFAQLAGLGWAGKNTLLINKHQGSYFFLAALLTTLELPVDAPHATDHCGTCRRCLDACPTDAFVAPGVLDARRCISYLSIEHRSAIPRELRSGMGDWLFGCDVCQDVCPWNRRGSAATDRRLAPRPESNPIDLLELFDLDDAAFRARFRATPLWRPRRRGILRNAAICLGNRGDPAAIPALAKGLGDAEPLIRGAAAWALGRIGGNRALRLLQERLAWEDDPEVLQEIRSATDELC